MNASGTTLAPRGLLAAVVVVLALAAGCTSATESADRQSSTATHRIAAGDAPADQAAEQPRPLPTPTPRRPPPTDPPGATPRTTRAAVPWRIHAHQLGGISGYAGSTSVLPGQPVTVYVSTPAPSFVVRAFRMGWYGGREGEQIWRSKAIAGYRQAPFRLTAAATRTYTADWAPSLTVRTTGWQPGDYLLRLDARSGAQSYIPLTVRARSAAGRVVLISPVTTWQAYNLWGCCDLYMGADGSFATRSLAVTFDRPYRAERGAGQFLRGELPILAEAERLGLRLDYVTDVDLQQHPDLLAGARAVVSMGHDEYWSALMRARLAAARDAGTNLAFFGANAIFRRVRFASTALGPDRLEINYKVAEEDPLYGVDNRAITADWPSPPDAEPESEMIGPQYACDLGTHAQAAGVVVDPTAWPFAGTGVRAGTQLPGLIGPETDAVQPDYPTPRPMQVLLHSPTACPNGVPAYADAAYHSAPSGAGVFDAGTIAWACAIDNVCATPVPSITERVTHHVTATILRTFARGPAGTDHPARDNLSSLGIGPSAAAPG